MEIKNSIFAMKLCQLEREYGHLQNRIQLFQGKHLDQIHQERERLQNEYEEYDLLLDKTAQFCRSHTMAHLAELQRNYAQQAEELLQAQMQAVNTRGKSTNFQDSAEAMALYAEFSIDFATQAMRYALIAAFRAMELQMQTDEMMTKGVHNTHE